MFIKLFRQSFLASILGFGVGPAAYAATIVNDGFEVGTHPASNRTSAIATTTPGDNGMPFYTVRSTGGTATIVDDTAFSGKALSVQGTAPGANYPVVGLMPLIPTLENVGDNVTLSFRFRFTNSAGAEAGSSNFRFGLHNSNGSTITADGQLATSDNDSGYYVTIGQSASLANLLVFQENGGTTPILGGTDRGGATTAANAFAGINDDLVHSVTFSVTRSSSTVMNASFTVDALTPVSVNFTTLRTAFDEVSFSNGFSATTQLGYMLDDVKVTATTFQIPEPASVGLVVAGLPLLLRRRPHGA